MLRKAHHRQSVKSDKYSHLYLLWSLMSGFLTINLKATSPRKKVCGNEPSTFNYGALFTPLLPAQGFEKKNCKNTVFARAGNNDLVSSLEGKTTLSSTTRHVGEGMLDVRPKSLTPAAWRPVAADSHFDSFNLSSITAAHWKRRMENEPQSQIKCQDFFSILSEISL